MSRILRILAIAVIAANLKVPVWAEESADVRQIRSLFDTIWTEEPKGNPAPIIGGTASDVVYYDARGGGPELWTVSLVGLEAMHVESMLREYATMMKKHPEWSSGAEVLHVNVKDDRAIALTQKWTNKPDSTVGVGTYARYQEVVMLAKIDGVWKITSSIVGVGYSEMTYKMDPKQ